MAEEIGQIVLLLTLGVLLFALALFWMRRSPLIILATAALALGAALVGFLLEYDGADAYGAVGHFVNVLFLSVQGLLINWQPEGSEGITLRIAMLASLATLVMLAYEALTQLLSGSIERVRLDRVKGHVVVCGLGRIGYDLVRDLRDSQVNRSGRPSTTIRDVVVIEPDRENDNLSQVSELGAFIVNADATDLRALLKAGADRAGEVFFVTGDDEANIEGACRLYDHLGERSAVSESGAPFVYVHLRYPELSRVVENSLKERVKPYRRASLKTFNVVDRSLQYLIDELILPWRPRRAGEVAHFVVVGFGSIAQQLCLRLANLAHFENLKRCRMTIVYERSEEVAIHQFEEMYPAFMPKLRPADPWMPDSALDDWAFGVSVLDKYSLNHADTGVSFVVNGGWVNSDAAPRSAAFVERVVDLAYNPKVKPVVFICKENDGQNYSLAQKLRAELDLRLKIATDGEDVLSEHLVSVPAVPIFAYVPRRPVLARLLDRIDLVSFGAGSAVCSHRELTSDLQHTLAVAIGREFHEKRMSLPLEDEQHSSRPVPDSFSFESMSEWERRSNFLAAAHFNVKLAVLERKVLLSSSVSATNEDIPVSAGVREIVARMEHNRWLAERLLDGWTLGPASDVRKQRPTLVDWESLPPEEQRKDHDQIDTIMRVWRSLHSVKLSAAGADAAVRGDGG